VPSTMSVRLWATRIRLLPRDYLGEASRCLPSNAPVKHSTKRIYCFLTNERVEASWRVRPWSS
jgi:hypothetical protein